MSESALSNPVLNLGDGDWVKEVFGSEILAKVGKQRLRKCRASILKNHLGKTIIEYSMAFDDDDSPSMYIGVLRSDHGWRAQKHAFSMLDMLTTSRFDACSDLRVPRPILYTRIPAFCLMEKAEGKLLRELVQEQEFSGKANNAILGAARWLAKLHNSHLRINKIRSANDEMIAALKFRRALVRILPPIASSIDSICKELVRILKASKCDDFRLIHGDYNPSNILCSENNITVIDFPESCMGDPAFDVGYFIAQTKMSCGFTRGTAVCGTFLDKYLEDSNSAKDYLQKRIGIYEAHTYLQRLYHTYWLLRLSPDQDLASEWLNESKLCLEKVRDVRN